MNWCVSRTLLLAGIGSFAAGLYALVTTIRDPLAWWSPGCQLSYVAVAGILLGARRYPLGRSSQGEAPLSDNPTPPARPWRRLLGGLGQMAWTSGVAYVWSSFRRPRPRLVLDLDKRELKKLRVCPLYRLGELLVRKVRQVAHIGLGVRALVAGGLVEVGSAYLGGGSLQLPVPLRDDLEDFKNRGMTPLVVYENKRAVGILGVTDRIRGTARWTAGRLKALGITRVGILSGDHERSTKGIALAAGVDDVWPDMTPEDKLGVIQRLEKQGHTVMFVGDGINDAPALASAHVGVAMAGAGTDVALETADVALMHDEIAKLPFLIALGRRMLTIIKWNIAFGLAFNAFAVLASGSGYLTPIMGAVVHNIGSIFVVTCAASLAFMNEPAAD